MDGPVQMVGISKITCYNDAILIRRVNTLVGIKSKTIGDEVFERLLMRIQTGDLVPGTTLIESSLATDFGVSRGPVREAIRRLQGIQLVSRESYLKARVINLTPRAVQELFEMREALEGFACRLATETMSDTDLTKLERDFEDGKLGDPEANFDNSMLTDFHSRIVKASGNTRIIAALCGDLYNLLRIYRRWSGSTGDRRPIANREHWQIIRAMKMRDPDLAESLMRSHIARAKRHLTVEVTSQPCV